MVTELGLRNNRLLLYALLYGFSQDKSGGYSGKQDYLMEWLGCSRAALFNLIQELKRQGLLYEAVADSGQKTLRTARYPCLNNRHDVQSLDMPCPENRHDVQNLDTACPENRHENVQNLDMACPENRHPTIYNNTDNTIYNYSCSRGPETPTTPPTAEEVAAYCRERGNDIDARRFVDYYAVSGWKRGGEPIEDWRALIRLWEQNGRANKAAPVTETSAAGNGTNGEAAKNSFDTDDFWAAALKKSYGG